ncbi:hypothetical protein CR513_48134, partial [Mucuna pruriens]
MFILARIFSVLFLLSVNFSRHLSYSTTNSSTTFYHSITHHMISDSTPVQIPYSPTDLFRNFFPSSSSIDVDPTLHSLSTPPVCTIPESSSHPKNNLSTRSIHPMVTRSKSNIFKLKQLHLATKFSLPDPVEA